MSSTPIPTPTLDGENGESADAEPAPTVTITQRELEEGFERAKEYQAIIGSIANEYLCPITRELPVDPVMAEDGRIYERSAIEWCIEIQGDDIKSPATNLPMGPRLLRALQVRNSIRMLIDSGAIEGDLAKQWNQRVEDEAMVAETEKKANDGDTDAMCDLGDWHFYGQNGLSVDEKQAYEWFKKAADLQSVRGMAEQAYALMYGYGVEKNELYGTALIGLSAGMGSDVGAFLVGISHIFGPGGTPKDAGKAKYWLSKAVDGSCTTKHIKLVCGSCRTKTKHVRETMLEDAKDMLNIIERDGSE